MMEDGGGSRRSQAPKYSGHRSRQRRRRACAERCCRRKNRGRGEGEGRKQKAAKRGKSEPAQPASRALQSRARSLNAQPQVSNTIYFYYTITYLTTDYYLSLLKIYMTLPLPLHQPQHNRSSQARLSLTPSILTTSTRAPNAPNIERRALPTP